MKRLEGRSEARACPFNIAVALGRLNESAQPRITFATFLASYPQEPRASSCWGCASRSRRSSRRTT